MNFRELNNSQTVIFVSPKGQHVEFRIDRTAFVLEEAITPYLVRYELFSSGYNGAERQWDYLGVGTDLDQMLFWRVPEALKLYDATGRGHGGRKQAAPTEAHVEAAVASLRGAGDTRADDADAKLQARRAARRQEAAFFLLEARADGVIPDFTHAELVDFLTNWMNQSAPVELKDQRRLLFEEHVAAYGKSPFPLYHKIKRISLRFEEGDAMWTWRVALRKGKSEVTEEAVALDPLQGWADITTTISDRY